MVSPVSGANLLSFYQGQTALSMLSSSGVGALKQPDSAVAQKKGVRPCGGTGRPNGGDHAGMRARRLRGPGCAETAAAISDW